MLSWLPLVWQLSKHISNCIHGRAGFYIIILTLQSLVVTSRGVHPLSIPFFYLLHVTDCRGLGASQFIEEIELETQPIYCIQPIGFRNSAPDDLPATQVAEIADIRMR